MQKAMDYIKRFNTCSEENTQSIRTMLSRVGIKEPEATKLWNLTPQSVEEAYSLIPTLREYPEDIIDKVISEF